MRLTFVLLLSAVLTGTGPASEPGKTDLDRLQGVWVLETRQEEGRDDKPKELGKVSVAIMGNKIKVNEDGNLSEGSFVLDAGKKPATIDLTPSKGEEQKVLGIYQVDGDTLKVCYGRPGVARPTEFATKADSKTVLMVFKKQTKKE